MGHQLAFIDIDASRAEQIRAESAHTAGRGAFERAMVAEAVAVWRAECAGRWDDERAGSGLVTRIVPAGISERYANGRWEEAAARSLVIPVASEGDTVARTQHFTVRVPQGYASRYRGRTPARAPFFDAGESDPVVEAARALLRPGEHIACVTVEGVGQAGSPRARKAPGRLEAVYEAVARDGSRGQRVLAEGPTLAAVREAAVRLMREDGSLEAVRVVSRQVRVAEDGASSDDLLVIDRGQGTVRLEVALTAEHVAADAKPDHWTVVFDYHT